MDWVKAHSKLLAALIPQIVTQVLALGVVPSRYTATVESIGTALTLLFLYLAPKNANSVSP